MDVLAARMRVLGVTSTKDLDSEIRNNLYGLKKVGRLWSKLLYQRLVGGGYMRCISDSCVYYRRVEAELVIAGVYVDDLLVTSTSSVVFKRLFDVMQRLSVKISVQLRSSSERV
uniref:Reverse transcriptase Ty1/copia-type domain-containing protein n=1 Tax=Peronospora matthiolae TaxID=2874970 RepID=A0AAV1TR27_9STRA